MTLTLCGFPLSNYYNKVKLVLLEKGLPFDEELHTFSSLKTDEVRAASPLGKVPFLRTPQGALCESEVIMGYLEAAFPDSPALLPADPFAAAKVRELSQFIDLHLELVARELYAQAFFGGTVSEDVKASVRKRLSRNIPAFQRLAKFGPYVAGDSFTQADCAAWVSLPLVAMAPLMGMQYHLPDTALVAMVLALLLGTPVLSLIGAIGAALTLGLRGGGILLSLLILPLYIPVLVYGSRAVTVSAIDFAETLPYFSLLGAFLLLALVLSPLAAAAALRIATE